MQTDRSIAIIPAKGLGDALILQIAAHQLSLFGYRTLLITEHRFGRWLIHQQYGQQIDLKNCDALFLQHDNTPFSTEIQQNFSNVYTFYGSHRDKKHPPLKKGWDFVADPEKTMVENVVVSLKTLFGIEASAFNGFLAPPELIHRRHRRRVAIHTQSGDPQRNFPLSKWEKIARWLEKGGLEPTFLPFFPSVEELASFLYESGYFLGNDSGPGHLASCLNIPVLTLGRDERHLRHWRPGWGGEIAYPPSWIPNFKGWKCRLHHWHRFITCHSIKKKIRNIIKL